MKARAAVILIQDDKIAMIERHRSGRYYFVFTGGKIEAGETPAITARREAQEELGLEVSIGSLVAEVWYLGKPQYYFLADTIRGEFGHGTGREMASLAGSAKGSHLPLWMPLSDVTRLPVLPKLMADFVAKSYPSAWPTSPLVVTDQPPDVVG